MNAPTPTLMRASEVNSLPVVTIDGGEDAAEIKDVVYDGAEHRLVGFTLNKRGWFRGSMKAVLAADSVQAIGPDAVMVATEADITEPSQAHASETTLEAPRELLNVVGNTVMSSGGAELGEVVDVIIETGAHPTAVGYEVSTDDGSVFVPSSAQMALSGDNLIVPENADQFVRNDLVGFGAAVRSFRELITSGDSA